jgi:carbamoyltransferase
MTTGVVGVANGKAEFGPRALGNRSILADPRTLEMKDKVNDIKHREPYRPFAPVIMEEHVSSCFDIIPGGSNMYMQYTYKCLEPNKYPAVCHVDGTSRVQSINFKQHPKLYMLLKKWYDETESPMLLNTSLNIKGQPIVNDINDVREFEKKYDLKVY